VNNKEAAAWFARQLQSELMIYDISSQRTMSDQARDAYRLAWYALSGKKVPTGVDDFYVVNKDGRQHE